MIVRFHSEFTANLQDLWNTNVNQIREQNSHLNREALRKLREAWRLTVLSSAMPSHTPCEIATGMSHTQDF